MQTQYENMKYLLSSCSTDNELTKIQNLDIYRILTFKMIFNHNEIKCKKVKSKELRVKIFDVLWLSKSKILLNKFDSYKLCKKFLKEKRCSIQFSAYFILEVFDDIIKLFNLYIGNVTNIEITRYIKKSSLLISNMYDEFIVKDINY